MASNVIRVSLLADAKNFEREFGKATGKAAGFGAAIGTMAGTVALQLGQRALGAVKDFVGSSVDSFNDLNESLNALEVIYGEQAEGIKKLGEESAQSLGVSNAEFNNHAVSIAAFAKQIAGDGGDVVGTVDTLTQRTADFASVMNMDFGEAAAKFRSGLAGESEPLRKFGIDVSAAKIETVALNTGIWDGVDAMTEGEKVQARYEAIMQQTADTAGDFANTADDAANKERILNAELENQKALLGQALMPLHNQWLEVQSQLIPVIGEVATVVGLLTGAIDKNQAALNRYQSATGDTVDTAADLLEAVNLNIDANVIQAEELRRAGGATEEWMDQLEELIGVTDLSTDELNNLKDQLGHLERQGFLTEDQVEALAAVIDSKLSHNLTEAEQAARDSFAANEDLAESYEHLEEDVESATEALKRHEDELRGQIDPVFNAIDAQNEYTEAQQATTEAVEEFGEGSPEHIEALSKEAQAASDYREAWIDLVAEGVDPMGPAFANAMKELGFDDSEIALMREQYLGFKAFIEQNAPQIDLSIRAPGVHYTDTGNGHAVPKRGQTYTFHEGGRVPGLLGEEVDATLEAGEEVISAEDVKALENAKRQPAGTTGPQTVINVTINAGMGTDGYEVGKQAIEAIQQYIRVAGPVHLEVRTD